jgi:hypothetical protein
MKQILRVEHAENGMGPYNQGSSPGSSPLLWYIMTRTRQDNLAMRWPKEERLISASETWTDPRFGFESKRQLAHWFNREERHVLADANFVLGIYDVPETAIVASEVQAVFDAAQAVKVKTLPLVRSRVASASA